MKKKEKKIEIKIVPAIKIEGEGIFADEKKWMMAEYMVDVMVMVLGW